MYCKKWITARCIAGMKEEKIRRTNLHCVRPKKDEGKSPQKDERKPKKR